MGNLNQIFTLYNEMQQSGNPAQFLSRTFGVDIQNMNPNDAIQHLLNTGRISQAQVNNAMQMKNNPMIKRLFGI